MAIAESPDQRLLERWRAVFENVPDVITELDRDGRILITNSFPGQELDQVIGRNIFDLAPEHLHDGLRRCIDQVFDSGEAAAIESHILTDRESWWITRFVPVREHEQVTSVLAIGTEFTARKRAENERERLIAELREALDKVEISERSGAEFSHGLCPTCAQELHAKLDELDDMRVKAPTNKD